MKLPSLSDLRKLDFRTGTLGLVAIIFAFQVLSNYQKTSAYYQKAALQYASCIDPINGAEHRRVWADECRRAEEVTRWWPILTAISLTFTDGMTASYTFATRLLDHWITRLVVFTLVIIVAMQVVPFVQDWINGGGLRRLDKKRKKLKVWLPHRSSSAPRSLIDPDHYHDIVELDDTTDYQHVNAYSSAHLGVHGRALLQGKHD